MRCVFRRLRKTDSDVAHVTCWCCGKLFQTWAVFNRQTSSKPETSWRLRNTNLWSGFDKARSSSIPAGVLQKQSVDVDALRRRTTDVILEMTCDVTMKRHRVQRPTFVTSSHLLSQTRQRPRLLTQRCNKKKVRFSYLLQQNVQKRIFCFSK